MYLQNGNPWTVNKKIYANNILCVINVSLLLSLVMIIMSK